MADHSKPTNTSLYTNYTTELDARFDDLAVGLDPAVTTATNMPTNSIRWNSANSYWEKYNGTNWVALDTGYEIDLAGARKILTNSASPALTITQTGAGNALVVEDSASPDATPFVIDANGNVLLGGISAVEKISVDGNYYGQTASNVTETTSQIILARRRTGGASVISGDATGRLLFQGYDGTGNIGAASITGAADGTPGTNDMPGRLVFSTTPVGSATPAERLRIDSAGRIGFGGAPSAGDSFALSKNITGSVNSYSVRALQTIQSDVTNRSQTFLSQVGTQAAAFNLSELQHFAASQGSIGAGSSVTSQFGFIANSTLIGATNNYGFYSNIASGTGRWNFYANGTAPNYFAGDVTIGNAFKVTSDGQNFGIQPTPLSSGTARTITIAELLNKLLNYTGGGGTWTLPTGANIEAGITDVWANLSFDFNLINSGSGALTIANGGNTTLGVFTVASGVSAQFRARRIAANNYTFYRIA